MAKSILKEKTYAFAIEIVRLSQSLQKDNKEYILSKQVLRSGTAIGALVMEAEFAQSKADFINKMSIGLKEANETAYWLSLLKDTLYIEENQFRTYETFIKEIIAILVATIKTAKANLQFSKQ